MTKIEYFRIFMREKLYLKMAYVIAAFTVARPPKNFEPSKYPYLVIYEPQGVGFIDPNNENKFTLISDVPPNVRLLTPLDKFIIKKGDMSCVRQDTETDVGIALQNALLVEEPAKGYFEYINKFFSAKAIEEKFLNEMLDEPDDDSQLEEGKLYIRNYIRLAECALYMHGMTQIFTPGSTYKTMTAPPGLDAKRKELIAEYGGNVNDATVLAKIQKGLLDYDTAYLKGDPGEGILNGKKIREIVRMKRFLMYGAEPGIEEKIELNTITKSLAEGWDVTRFDAMSNAQRAGSFSRGAQTQLGGESVKWMLRASSNINVTIPDCGTKLGVPVIGTDELLERNKGYYAIVNGATIRLGDDNIPQLKGKSFMLRSPGLCRATMTDYCECCVGPKLSIHKTGLSSAVAAIGDTFLGIFMSAAHAKGLQLARWNHQEAIF